MGCVGLLPALAEKERNTLPRHAKQRGDFLHRHALGVQCPRFRSAQSTARLKQAVEVFPCDLQDQASLDATEN